MITNLNEIRKQKEKQREQEAIVDIPIQLGGKYLYVAGDGQKSITMIVDVDTHVALVDFTFGTPIKTIPSLNRDKKESLQELVNSLSGKLVNKYEMIME